MARQIQLRRGNLSDWTSNNPVLATGEMVLVSSTNNGVYNQYRIGNGSSPFNALPVYEYTGVLGYGSPQGVYANSAALIAANPNRMYIYLVQDTGFWWYWNTSLSAWTAGGLYQAPLSVVQVPGASTTDVMSQKAVTNAIDELGMVVDNRIDTLENVLNSINPNQEARTTASGIDTISLPKTAANTGMQVQVFGQSATNLVNGANIPAGGSVTFATIAGHKYYVSNQAALITGDGNDYTSTNSGATTINIIVVNLTATFGGGSEPTVGNAALLFPSYFAGSDNVLGTGRVRSVGKNLLNLNTYGKKIYTGTLDGMTQAQRLLHYDILMPIARTGIVSGSVSEYVIAPNRVEVTTSTSSYGIGFKIKAKAGDIFTSKTTSSNGYIGFGSFNSSGVNLSNGIGTFTCPEGTAFILVALVANTANVKAIFTDSLIERGTTATTYEPFRQSALYLQSPELRSNGLIKDEIRKGTNGYELVKRVGVSETANEGVENIPQPLNFTSGWSNTSQATINSATQFTTTGGGGILFMGGLPGLNKNVIVRIKGTVTAGFLYIRNSSDNTGRFLLSDAFDVAYITNYGISNTLYLQVNTACTVNIEKLSIKAIDGISTIVTPSKAWELGANVHYTLATPTITPIAHGGLLNSNSNGTAYFEPVIADAGVYGTNLAIQATDYPIASFESIRKYANGTYAELSLTTGLTIAPDGLSFTHTGLTAGDLVMFTYNYNRESIGRSMTLTHYDNRYVIADTANGKVYRWGITSTNGVASITLTEV